MPVREVSVRYELPANARERKAYKEYHALSNRVWVSTAVVDGRERMKFSRFEECEVPPATAWNAPKPAKAKLRKYPGHDSKGRAEWDR